MPLNPPETGLDPENWDEFRAAAHAMLSAALDRLQDADKGRVWTPLPDEDKASFSEPLPPKGLGPEYVRETISNLMPYGVGNTHPRFFGWVHGSGTPANMIAEIAAAAMNANLGGRDHGAMYVEKQVIAWCRDLFRFPETSSGLVVSGTSMATVIALKVARDRALGFVSRTAGVEGARLVGYASAQAHSCVSRAFDILGIGSDALRAVPVDADFRMNTATLEAMIAEDRGAGLTPFAVVGTAGAVNVGSIDDLDALASIASRESLWFHMDGAFGAACMLSDTLRPRLKGLERADSLAFDFHKWMHVNYDAGCVLLRSESDHRRSFSDRPDYLVGTERGLSAGNPWPVEYGPELSRWFRALKIWAQLAEFGPERLGQLVEQNCAQARYLGQKVKDHPNTELMAPVALNICCFRAVKEGASDSELDALNNSIVLALQESGIAAPSTTRINGHLAIRVNITNHRTRMADLDLLFDAVLKLAEKSYAA